MVDSHLFVLEELLVLRLVLEDALDHLLEFENGVVFLCVKEDGRLVAADHEKHVHGGQVLALSLIEKTTDKYRGIVWGLWKGVVKRQRGTDTKAYPCGRRVSPQ